ncbi:MAG: hypothetical protein N2C14_18665 [Planctomycetales bacterium]
MSASASKEHGFKGMGFTNVGGIGRKAEKTQWHTTTNPFSTCLS